MKKPNPEYIGLLKELIKDAPYPSLLSMTIEDIGVGFSIIEIDLGQKHLQPFGLVHGGVISTIIDMAAFWAVFFGIEEEDGLTSVDLKLNFLAPVTSGRLIAKGRQIRLGKKIGFADVEVTNEKGEILAHGSSTLMVLPYNTLSEYSSFPEKYIEKSYL